MFITVFQKARLPYGRRHSRAERTPVGAHRSA
jgi:hypothetical protein